MSASLVGSEMCIRDRLKYSVVWERSLAVATASPLTAALRERRGSRSPVSYTHLTLPTICSV
eukprot:813696-Alexandrium_andersonii.AAC.1